MNGKLILTLDGQIVSEHSVDRETFTIGRRHDNEIQLNDLTVSGRHALISHQGGKTFVEDLGSTNGTLLNGSHIKSALLKHGDTLQLGHHQFTYLTHDQAKYEPTMFVRAELDETQFALPDWESREESMTMHALAGLRTLNGPLARAVMELRKPFSTIGFQGEKLALIRRGPNGYTIAAAPREQTTIGSALLNGEPLDDTPRELQPDDIVNIAGFEVQFFLVR